MFLIFADGAAEEIFKRSSIEKVKVYNVKKMRTGSKRIFLKKVVEKFAPNFMFLGLSRSQNCVDHVARSLCTQLGIRCGVIQDYWGYLGNFKDATLPDYFFVFDDVAARLTQLNAKRELNCFAYGSPKHEAYKYLLPTWLEHDPFGARDGIVMLYIGQPSNIEGVYENFLTFVDVLSKFNKKIKIYFKPHPSEHSERYKKVLEDQPNPFKIMERNSAVEPALLHADIVVTCFSTSGYDHNHLQFYSKTPLGSLIYLTVGDSILLTLSDVVGEPQIPSASLGMGRVCYTKDEFDLILNGYSENLRGSYFKVVKQELAYYRNSTKRIYKKIISLCQI